MLCVTFYIYVKSMAFFVFFLLQGVTFEIRKLWSLMYAQNRETEVFTLAEVFRKDCFLVT